MRVSGYGENSNPPFSADKDEKTGRNQGFLVFFIASKQLLNIFLDFGCSFGCRFQMINAALSWENMMNITAINPFSYEIIIRQERYIVHHHLCCRVNQVRRIVC